MVKVTSLLAKAGSGLRFSFGVRAWTGMEIRCIFLLEVSFSLYMPLMHRISISAHALTLKLKPTPLPALASRLVMLKMPTH